MGFFGTISDHDLALNRSDVNTLGIIGQNNSIGTTFEDLSDPGGVHVFPSADTALELVSTSANDTLLGTGCRQVRVVGENSVGTTIVQDINMNGTTAVALTTDLFRSRVIVNQDADPTGNGRNDGTITLRESGGGQTWIAMAPENGVSLSSILRVPTGKIIKALQFVAFTPKADSIDIRLTTQAAGSNSVLSGASIAIYQTPFTYRVATGFEITPESDLRYQAKASNPNSQLTWFAEFYLQDA